MSDAPIFVVGFGRSGTTLLQSLLGAHPRIAAPPEMQYFFRVWEQRDRFGDLNDDAVLREVVQIAVRSPALVQAGFTADRSFAAAKGGERTYAGVLASIMGEYAERKGKPRWSEKTPGQRPGLVWRHFPDAQVVHIVRDPRDTIASHQGKWWAEKDPVNLARRWRAFTLGSIAEGRARGPAQYLFIRYEDLAADPDALMRQVFSFLGEEHDPGVVRDPERRRPAVPVGARGQPKIFEPITAPSSGEWRTKLQASTRARIGAVIERVVAPLGYPEPSRATVLAGRALLLSDRITRRPPAKW